MKADGFLIVDKPRGLTSRAVVDAGIGWFGRGTRVGHAGTLDPLASGVLVLGVGRATRLIDLVQAMPKTYEAEIVLGATSATDDAEGPIAPTAGAQPPPREAIDQLLAGMIGFIEQSPPAYSAVKSGGRRAYAAARRGDLLSLPPRRVRIDQIEVLSYQFPTLELRIDCGKGTYIRSVARDLGRALGCGGYVSKLRRTRIGPFTIESALPLDSEPIAARRALLPMRCAATDLPSVILPPDVRRRLCSGQRVEYLGGVSSGLAAVLDDAGHLVALARGDRGFLVPERVVAEP